MNRLYTMSLVSTVVILVMVSVLVPGGSCWPAGAAMYECCCPKEFACQQSCFMCRNRDFVCNCGQCSCYTDAADVAVSSKVFTNKGLMEQLLRTGKGTHSAKKS